MGDAGLQAAKPCIFISLLLCLGHGFLLLCEIPVHPSKPRSDGISRMELVRIIACALCSYGTLEPSVTEFDALLYNPLCTCLPFLKFGDYASLSLAL